MYLSIATTSQQGALMSRHLNKVLAVTVFVAAFSCFIPLSSGANFSDTGSAQVLITIQIPETTPTNAPQGTDEPQPDDDTSATPPVDEPSTDVAPPPVSDDANVPGSTVVDSEFPQPEPLVSTDLEGHNYEEVSQ